MAMKNIIQKRFSLLSYFKRLIHSKSIMQKQSLLNTGLVHDVLRFDFSTKTSKQRSESSILKDVSALMIKRLPKKKTPRFSEDGKRVEMNSVVAYAVAEELSLTKLSRHLQDHHTYTEALLPNDVGDAIHVQATDFDQGKKDIFIFEDGSVVFWCVPELERKSFMRILRKFAEGPFKKDLYYDKEEMDVEFTTQNSRVSGDVIHLQTTPTTPTTPDDPRGQQHLHLYSFSNALAQSVKLGMWETSLGLFVESIEGVTEDLKHGRKIKMSRREVLMKTGELFSLRHLINLSSDLLDTPDFYWDRSDLEPLYTALCVHLNIRRRTRVINEKLTHCVELTELLTSQLNDAHHIRLEWMIIVLIMVEVIFEFVHYIESFLDRRQQVEEVTTNS